MPKVLKIAVVVGVFPEVSQAFIINQLGFLKQSGHKVEVLCTRHLVNDYVSNPILERYNLLQQTKVFKWRELMPATRFKRFCIGTSILLKTRKVHVLYKLLKRLNIFKHGVDAFFGPPFFKAYYRLYFEIVNFDVVHVHFADNAIRLYRQLATFNKRIVVTFHGYDAHNYAPSFYKKLVALKHIYYTVNSQYTKQKVLALGFKAEQISQLPVGLNTNLFKPTLGKSEPDRFTIVFIGRLIALKAPLMAVKICEQLFKNGEAIELQIIGEGPLFEPCKAYISQNNLSNVVSLLGKKSQSEIIKILDGANMLLLAGIVDDKQRSEAQGLVIQEAQSMGLPVVVSDVGGMAEGLIPNKTGFVLEANNLDGFVERIQYLIKHPQERETMGGAGRQFVIDHYDSKVLGAQLLNVYTNNG